MKIVSYYELRNDDGDGRHTSLAGFVSNEETAQEWKNENSVWRGFTSKTIEICESLDELKEVQFKKKVSEMTRSFTTDEIYLLREAFNRGML